MADSELFEGDLSFAMEIPLCSHAGPDLRLKTGVLRAFGKPQGAVARIHFQVIMSTHTTVQDYVIKALVWTKFIFFWSPENLIISPRNGLYQNNTDEGARAIV